MELDRKFQMATACRSVTIGSLRPYQEYLVVHAECVNTSYGPSVLLASTSSVKVFLHKRYGEIVSDEDIENINSGLVLLYLVYKGMCPKSNSYVLELQLQQVSKHIPPPLQMDDPSEIARRLDAGDLLYVHALELMRPYNGTNVRLVTVGTHRWCILTLAGLCSELLVAKMRSPRTRSYE